MKQGRTLQELATEIQRQKFSKREPEEPVGVLERETGAQVKKKLKPDVEITNCGSIVLFHASNKAAHEWIEENVSGETTWFGNSLAVEPRYAGDLAEGMQGAGLVVK